MEDDFVGAIKIKDGLFIGDEYAAQDFEFIVTNKVTHIINCAGKQIPNYWETVGVVYLTYDWMDSENQIVFDAKGEVVNQIFGFVEEAVKLGEGVLVHSLKGQSRSCCVLTAYFMKRYRWSLYKTLEFLTSRRSDLEIRTSFYHQLLNLESRLFQQGDGNVTVNWHETGPEDDHEEALLRNTFLNARNAPFDEALVNPQLHAGTEPKSRKLNWTDEKTAHKAGPHTFFSKDSLAARLARPLMNTVKSILKGSNKIFKLKHKGQEEESAGSSKSAGVPNSGMRMHKSVRNLSEGRNQSENAINDSNSKSSEKEVAIVERQEPKNLKNANMYRSSSATYLEREENSKSPIANKSAVATSAASVDKSANGKVANINGNIIHLTVNNYLAPVNNLSNATQNSSSAELKESIGKPPIAAQSQGSRQASQKYNSATDTKKDDTTYNSNKGAQADSPTPNTGSNQIIEKSMMSTNQLKSAIEKKLSKEYKSQMPTLQKGEAPVIVTKIANASDKNLIEPKAKTPKEYAKPSDIKVNYQVLLKSRETPPPRKRDDGKKIPESPQRKPVSKTTATSSKGSTDSNLPYSSYLTNLFSTSFSHLNTVTPSAYATNYSNADKKTPISAKATTPMTYNLNLSQKAQTLTRPQRATSNTISDKEYNSSTLGSSLTKSKLVYTNTPNSASNLSAKYNNYLSQSKNNPVRITYEKLDRPHSATPDRSATPQAGVRRMGTPSNVNLNRSGGTTDQRLSVPSKSSKHTKKDSGSTQELLAKYRQRSSSPSQMSYNPVLSSSALSSKSRAKY